MAKRKKNPESIMFWRVAISAIGLALISMAVGKPLIYFAGEKARVFAVQTRRIGGSDVNQAAGARYQWDISYSFTDRNGEVHSGYAKRRGGDIGVQVERQVYYLPAAPFFHVLESEGKPNGGHVVMFALGVGVIYVLNRKGVKGKKTS